jgi:hypothetical protein
MLPSSASAVPIESRTSPRDRAHSQRAADVIARHRPEFDCKPPAADLRELTHWLAAGPVGGKYPQQPQERIHLIPRF